MTSTPVSAVSKRRLPLPSFTLRDQLCIASCVMRVGQGNWNTVARMAKQLAGMTLGADGEGLDRFSQRNCAAEYSRLEESSAAAAVSAHKRRRSELAAPSTGSAGSDTTAAQLVSKLTLERIEQLRAVVEQQKREIRTARVEAKAMEGEKQSNAQLCASIRSSYEKLGRPIPEDILKKIEAHEQQHNEQSSAPQTPSTAHASDAEVFSSPSRPPATAMIDAQKNELTSATPLQTAEIKCEADAAETVTATVAAPKPAPSPAVPRKSQGRPGRGSTSGAARVAPMELPLEFPTWDHYKQWKKEIVGCYREAASHRHANIFAYPVTDNIAPGYSSIILHPMDMSSIKRRIESGAICSTAQFEHAILEMWANAVMYNNSDTDVHKMAAEMAADTLAKLQTMLPRHFDYQPLTIPDVLRNKSDEFMLLSPEPEDEPTDSRSEVSSSSSKQRAVFGTPVSGTVKHLRSSHPHRGTRTSITTPQPKPVQETDTASTASRPAATPTSPPPPPAPSSNAGSDVETGSGQTRRRRRRISSSDDSDDVPLATLSLKIVTVMEVDEANRPAESSNSTADGADATNTALAPVGTQTSVTLTLHPLVIMNMSEHYTRVGAQQGSEQQVYGAIIGKQRGRNLELMNSFEFAVLNVEGNMVIDMDYYRVREAQYREVFADLEFLGWYTNGATATLTDTTLHRQVCEINESPVMLKFDPKELQPETLPVKAFESWMDVKNEGNLLFVPVPYTLATEEAERIGVDHVARLSRMSSGVATHSQVTEHMMSQYNAVKMLSKRVALLLAYLESVTKGELPRNESILRDIKSICCRLPVMQNAPKFEEQFCSQQCDVVLTAYLGSMTKLCNTMNQLVNKMCVVQERTFLPKRQRHGLFL